MFNISFSGFGISAQSLLWRVWYRSRSPGQAFLHTSSIVTLTTVPFLISRFLIHRFAFTALFGLQIFLSFPRGWRLFQKAFVHTAVLVSLPSSNIQLCFLFYPSVDQRIYLCCEPFNNFLPKQTLRPTLVAASFGKNLNFGIVGFEINNPFRSSSFLFIHFLLVIS